MKSKFQAWCKNVYDRIVYDPRNNLIEDNYEIHHIVPRSIGGTNDTSNLVRLTYRQHFICHWLLWKMFSGLKQRKMCHAFHMMSHQPRFINRGQRLNSVSYASLKKMFCENQSEKSIFTDKNFQSKMSKRFWKKITLEQRQSRSEKISKAVKLFQSQLVTNNEHHFQGERGRIHVAKQVKEGRHPWSSDSKKNWWKMAFTDEERSIEMSKRGKKRYSSSIAKSKTGEKSRSDWAKYTPEQRQNRIQKMKDGQKAYYAKLKLEGAK